MTEQPKIQRIRPNDFCMADASPFQQHYEARTTHPLPLVACGEAFMDLRHNLRPGDEVAICQYDKADYRSARLVAFCKIRVVKVEVASVEVTPPYDAFKVPSAESEPEAEAEPDILYSDGSWQAEWGGPSHLWRVKNGAGDVVAKGLAKDGADLIAKGNGIGITQLADGSYEIHDPEGLLEAEAA